MKTVHCLENMPGFKDKFRAFLPAASPSKEKSGPVEGSQAETDVDSSKIAYTNGQGNGKAVETLNYDPSEDRRLLKRSRAQLWVWRCISYLLLAALIGEHLLYLKMHEWVLLDLVLPQKRYDPLARQNMGKEFAGPQDALALLERAYLQRRNYSTMSTSQRFKLEKNVLFTATQMLELSRLCAES